MAQSSWIYPDEKGRHHSVGLYHGDKSGHFVLYYNARIIKIDFKVLESKTYSFFIEDELCEVFLIQQADGTFEYDFKINTEIDTPSNNLRKENKEKDWKKTLVFFTILVLSIGFFGRWTYTFLGARRATQIFGTKVQYSGSKYKAVDLQLDGKLAEGVISFQEKDDKKNHLMYSFKDAKFDIIEGEIPIKALKNTEFHLPNGFPAEEGATFYLKYHPENPTLHVLDFMQPTGETLIRYMELAIKAELESSPDLDPQEVLCRVQLIGRESGLMGLALLLHRKTTSKENSEYNQNRRKQMLEDQNLTKLFATNCKTAAIKD